MFFPILMGTAADKPPKPLKCKKMHDLSNYNYYWMHCEICRAKSTSWSCWNCNYHICGGCFDGDRKGKEMERRDPSLHPTFLRCANTCSFTLQVPVAGGANASSGCYTLSLEVRFEKLPPKNQLQSLLRFSLPDLAQAHRLHRTSVYLNGEGRVVGRPLLVGGEIDANSSKIIAGRWHVVSVVVNPTAGTLTSYINGIKCHTSTDLDISDLRLQHRVVILGGGKQAHVRGGDMRRVQILSGSLSDLGAMNMFYSIANDNPGTAGRLARFQALYRGYHHRRVIREAEEAEKAKEEAEKAKELELELEVEAARVAALTTSDDVSNVALAEMSTDSESKNESEEITEVKD